MHLSLFHSRCYFSVFYRQLINNSLGNLPSGLFSNLGNLTELYVEIYMYRSLFFSLTQFALCMLTSSSSLSTLAWLR